MLMLRRCAVVHVVDRDPAARDGLRRIAGALESLAVAQSVLELESEGAPRARRLGTLQAGLAQIWRQGDVHAVHLHGWESCLLAPLGLKEVGPGARVLVSPHGSHLRDPWTSALLGRLLRRRLAPFHHAPLAASLAESQRLGRLLGRSAELLPHRVGEPFFACARREEPRPHVVALGEGAAAVDMVTRLSVLLNGRERRVDFVWLGPSGMRARQLEAAQVERVEAPEEAQAAGIFSRAWLAIVASREQGMPGAVAQAMAAGVPCLATDIPAHRVVHHGETGFLCASEQDFLERTVLLLRDATERRRVGQAARDEAARRFTEWHYHSALLRAYRLPATPRALAAPDITSQRPPCTPLQAQSPAWLDH